MDDFHKSVDNWRRQVSDKGLKMNAIPSLVVLLVLSAPSLAGPLEKRKSPTKAVQIRCSATKSDKVRIVDEDGKPVYTSGRVELKTRGKWEPVCAFNFFDKEAKSVCGSLCESGAKPMVLVDPSAWSAKAPMEMMRCDRSSTDIKGCKNIPASRVPPQVHSFCRRNAAYVRCVDKKEVPKATSIGKIFKIDRAVRIKSVDNPNVIMKMFSDKEMTKPVIQGHDMLLSYYPWIYTSVEDECSEITTAMAVRRCWVTPVPDKDSKKRLELINNACHNPTYVKEMSYPSNKKQTFVFQPFLFEGYNTFYLHCKANICDEADQTEKCMRWCSNPDDAFKGRGSGKCSTNLELPEASTKRSAGSRT